ncbi:S1C family serine protease [Zavarzinella formosa]|uniref:S1C family serine protease n=1 Tax=Zavarzinella formosa TaxID=360055 RepID=UPI0002D35467|nr:S1C family serine protease [Zavarzinella formosa]
MRLMIAIMCLGLVASSGRATDPYSKTASAANEKLVKLFGAGGFRGAESFGTGIIISPEGHILTAATPFLDGRELRLHLPDGRKMPFKVKVIEPEFDAAILEIVQPKKDALPLDLPYFDIKEAGAKLNVQTGDWVMALSNMYNVATRDEMLSVQRAMVTAIGKLSARRGAFEVPFHGDVLYLDTITNNPGAAGGAIINRKGELLGLIGKEFRNTQTDTWVNYAMPLNTKAEINIKGEKKTFTLAEFADLAMQGKWIKSERPEVRETKGPTAYTGIIFVPRVVERTPPYIEQIDSNSPAAKAGLKPDDLVIYFDGEPVYSTDTFRDLLKRYSPGDKVQIEIRRGDKLTAISLDLQPLPKR